MFGLLDIPAILSWSLCILLYILILKFTLFTDALSSDPPMLFPQSSFPPFWIPNYPYFCTLYSFPKMWRYTLPLRWRDPCNPSTHLSGDFLLGRCLTPTLGESWCYIMVCQILLSGESCAKPDFRPPLSFFPCYMYSPPPPPYFVLEYVFTSLFSQLFWLLKLLFSLYFPPCDSSSSIFFLFFPSY